MSKPKGRNKRTGQDMTALGSLGGKANTRENVLAAASAGGRAAWGKLTKAERSEIMRRRARKAWATRRKNGTKKGKGNA